MYDGEWNSDNQRDGNGILVVNGSILEGFWREGKLNGKARQIYADGAMFVGEHKEDIKQGYGQYHYISGDRYEGLWSAGHPHGKGLYTWANGQTY